MVCCSNCLKDGRRHADCNRGCESLRRCLADCLVFAGVILSLLILGHLARLACIHCLRESVGCLHATGLLRLCFYAVHNNTVFGAFVLLWVSCCGFGCVRVVTTALHRTLYVNLGCSRGVWYWRALHALMLRCLALTVENCLGVLGKLTQIGRMQKDSLGAGAGCKKLLWLRVLSKALLGCVLFFYYAKQ